MLYPLSCFLFFLLLMELCNKSRVFNEIFFGEKGKRKINGLSQLGKSSVNLEPMVVWGNMTLKSSTEFREPNFGGGGLRNHPPLGANIWKEKYSNNWQERYHTRMLVLIKGPLISNLTWENRAIVQKHSFWEIRDGNLTWFREDYLQQEQYFFRDGLTSLKNDNEKNLYLGKVTSGLR